MVSPVTRCSTTFANKDTTYRDEVLRQMPETKLCAPSRKLDTLYIFTILYVYTAYYPFTLPLCFSKRQEQHKPEKAKNLQPTLPTAFLNKKNLKQGAPTMWQYVLSKYNQTIMNRWSILCRQTKHNFRYTLLPITKFNEPIPRLESASSSTSSWRRLATCDNIMPTLFCNSDKYFFFLNCIKRHFHHIPINWILIHKSHA